MSSLVLSAVECPHLSTSLSEAVLLSTDDNFFPTTVNISCDYGFEMLLDVSAVDVNVTSAAGGGDVWQTSCQYDGSWSFDVANVTCQRKSSLLLVRSVYGGTPAKYDLF